MEQSLIIKKKYLQEGFELSGWVELVGICQLFDQSKIRFQNLLSP